MLNIFKIIINNMTMVIDVIFFFWLNKLCTLHNLIDYNTFDLKNVCLIYVI